MKNLYKQTKTVFSLRWFVLLISIFLSPLSHAFDTYLQNFNTVHGTQGTQLDSCGVCHFNFNGAGPRTPYGEDFRLNNYDASAITNLDSDNDGSSNGVETGINTLTMPGLNCTNYIQSINAPANLADYVDPARPGCPDLGQPPIASINGPYFTITGSPLSFSSAGSVDPDGTIVSYLWNFGSGYGTSNTANPVFTYNIPFESTIQISLTVTDNTGNTDTATTTVVVLKTPNSPPLAHAGPAASGAINTPLQFNASASSDPDGDNMSYYWEFGDGSSASGIAPTHSYGHCGIYNVTLIATDIHNLIGMATTIATVSGSGTDAPTANAGGGAGNLYSGTSGSNIQFDGSASTDPDCYIVNYSWDFGDGNNGQGINPVHSYATAGSYVVTLTVTDTDNLTAVHTATVDVVDAAPLDGALLYDTNCAGCHGAGNNSSKIGADVIRINDGINTVTGMSAFATSLSSAQIQAIAGYLGSLSTPPPPATGSELYMTYCASCHGPGSSSTKAGATVIRINAGIGNVAQMNGLATSLSAANIQAIADYLAILSTPTTPQAVYNSYCAACHGADGSGGSSGEDVRGDSARRIKRAINGESEMQFLSAVTNGELQLISDFLNGITTPPPSGGGTGATLYANNCAGCHGPGDNSAKAGASVARINNGINSVSGMSSLSTILSSADIQAIADYLAGVTPPPPVTDGAGLYSTNCAGCHGPGDYSSKAGATVARINDGINSVSAMNSLASNLSSADIQAIADYLNSVAMPSTDEGRYVAYCAACHGADARGGSSGENVRGESVRGIREAIRGEREMRFLGFLSAEELSSISDYLNSFRLSRRSRYDD